MTAVIGKHVILQSYVTLAHANIVAYAFHVEYRVHMLLIPTKVLEYKV